MEILAKSIILFVAVMHLAFLYLEMIAWTTIAPKVFRQFKGDFFEQTKSLAANQGLYNGFLSAGLIWSLVIDDAGWSFNIALFFLVCVIVAGIFGAVTASRKIFYIQAAPAILALILLLMAY